MYFIELEVNDGKRSASESAPSFSARLGHVMGYDYARYRARDWPERNVGGATKGMARYVVVNRRIALI
jgi:hypothetical protein